MRRLRNILCVGVLLCIALAAHGTRPIVIDVSTHRTLPFASVFDKNGKFIGMSGADGRLPTVSEAELPLTIKYLGFNDCLLSSFATDTVYMQDIALELPEIVVESKKHSHLHLLAYMREYSTLSTLTDTVEMFREKMVDFMTPVVPKTRLKGWRTPRVLTSKSFYRFSNDRGLDSVSDRCNNHFSWSDWMGIAPTTRLPETLCNSENATDTVFGKYSLTELWRKDEDRVSIDLDILADTSSRKWVPNLSVFFRKETDFEYFKARFNYSPVFGDIVSESNLTGYSFNIESKGRGRGMFRFNRREEPFYVTTYCEIYIIDKEYVTHKEATKWEKLRENADNATIFVPEEAPPLQPSVLQLISRVNALDHDNVRLATTPDLSNIGHEQQRVSVGQGILRRLKGMLGIDHARASRKWNKNYNNFRKNQQRRNRKS